MQLIDTTTWFRPLRKNMGKKNCELSEENIAQICDTFLRFEESEQSKIFDNAAFGYSKVTVERPLRIPGTDPYRAYTPKGLKELRAKAGTDESAPCVIREDPQAGHGARSAPRAVRGHEIDGKRRVVEYEPDSGAAGHGAGAAAGGRRGRDVLPPGGAAPTRPMPGSTRAATKTGYEISFTRYLQAAAAPHARRNPGGYPGTRAGDGWAAGRDPGVGAT